MKENIINWLIKITKADTNLINDGFHSFKQLYDHRIGLFIALCREYNANVSNVMHGKRVWKSKTHSDGSSMDGWFIMGIGTRRGQQITYHLPMVIWNKLEDIKTVKKAPKFDGHTPDEVLFRLSEL